MNDKIITDMLVLQVMSKEELAVQVALRKPDKLILHADGFYWWAGNHGGSFVLKDICMDLLDEIKASPYITECCISWNDGENYRAVITAHMGGKYLGRAIVYSINHISCVALAWITTFDAGLLKKELGYYSPA